MRNSDFSAGRTWLGAKSSIASVILRTMASIGSFSSASNSALRGVNHARSLCLARLRRKVRASGRKYGTAAAGAGFCLVAMQKKFTARDVRKRFTISGFGFVMLCCFAAQSVSSGEALTDVLRLFNLVEDRYGKILTRDPAAALGVLDQMVEAK